MDAVVGLTPSLGRGMGRERWKWQCLFASRIAEVTQLRQYNIHGSIVLPVLNASFIHYVGINTTQDN